VLGEEEERREWIGGLRTGDRPFLLLMTTMRWEEDEHHREGFV